MFWVWEAPGTRCAHAPSSRRRENSPAGGEPAANPAQRPPQWAPERELGVTPGCTRLAGQAGEGSPCSLSAWNAGVLRHAVRGCRWLWGALRASSAVGSRPRAARACPGWGPISPNCCRPAGGISWLLAQGEAGATNYLKLKGRHCWALEGAQQCLCHEGSGLAAGCRRSLEQERKKRAGS